MRAFFLLLGLWSLPVMAAGPFDPAQTTDARLVTEFGKVALTSEYGGGGAAHVRKWTVPIRWHFDGMAEAARLGWVRDHMAVLAQVTGHDIAEVAPDADANFRILWARKADYPRLAHRLMPHDAEVAAARFIRASCFILIRTDGRRGHLADATVVLPPDFPAPRLRHCVVEELTQAMGIPNDNNTVLPSIFNDRSRILALSWKDRVFLRLLYDAEMTAGADAEEALGLAQRKIGPVRSIEGVAR